MNQASFSWNLSKTTLHVCLGDLFEVDADAIVNSEQRTVADEIRLRKGTRALNRRWA